MVLQELRAVLPSIPDPRPSKADAEQRAKRKQHEKEHPHFAMQEFGMKAGVLALMGALTLYPWEKKIEEHKRKEHPERFERQGGRGGDDKRGDDGREDRRRSLGGDGREMRSVGRADRESRRSAGAGGNRIADERIYRAPIVERRPRRRTLDEKGMKLAVAEGFEYITPDKAYLDDISYRRSVDADHRPRTESEYSRRSGRDSRR
jgi:hypothetical protein